MKVVTAHQMRKIERVAIDELGIPALLLMENAAIAIAQACIDDVKTLSQPKIAIVCGMGNNGGDGIAVARQLFTRCMDVQMILVGDEGKMSPDCRANYLIATKMRIPTQWVQSATIPSGVTALLQASDLVVDALFGIGLTRDVTGACAQMIALINAHAKRVLAVDTPSGICADSGQVRATAVFADRTVCPGYAKLGNYLYPGAQHAGKTVVCPISIPEETAQEVKTQVLFDCDIKALLPTRPQRSHKYAFGAVYALVGCDTMTGAAILSTAAAYKVGCGVVHACGTRHVTRSIQSGVAEAVTVVLPEIDGALCRQSAVACKDSLRKATVALIGCGLSHTAHTAEFVQECLQQLSCPTILDADALNALSNNVQQLQHLPFACAITPHIGEMSRLTGKSASEILADPIQTARGFASEFHVTVVLKDARTIVADPYGNVYINTTGTDALAKAGSGDVLAGMMSGLAAQGTSLYDAAVLATYLHGKAGALAAQSKSNYGVSASDLVDCIPAVLKSIG